MFIVYVWICLFLFILCNCVVFININWFELIFIECFLVQIEMFCKNFKKYFFDVIYIVVVQEENVMIRMISVQLVYGYEYFGNLG